MDRLGVPEGHRLRKLCLAQCTVTETEVKVIEEKSFKVA